MRAYWFFLLLILSANFLFTQPQFNTSNLKVTQSDLTIENYASDSTANALVIFEEGNSYIDEYKFDVITEIKKKIKIFNKDGFDKATVEVYLYNNEKNAQQIRDIKATTYNFENGKKTAQKVNKSQIFNEQRNENYKITKIAFPNIKEGSVITYSYTLVSPFIFKYYNWEFQDDIPKLFSRYKTSIPGIYHYNIKLVGGLKNLSKNSENLKRECLKVGNGGSADCAESVYEMENIPAFIEEDFMTAKDNFLRRIDYELKVVNHFDGTKVNYTKSWKTVEKEIRNDKDLGRQLKKSVNVDKLLDENILAESSPFKKANQIYNFIKNNYSWNGKHRLFTDVSVKRLLKEGSGNAAEINILLHNALEESGFNVNPILVSTRQNGWVTKLYPVLSDFNYLIVNLNINGIDYWLDATDKYLAFGQVPFKCLNGDARFLDFKNGSKWVEIKAKKPTSIMHDINLSMKNGVLTGHIKNRYTGYQSLSAKKKYYSDPDKYIKDFEDENINFIVDEHTILSEGEDDEFFEEKFEINFDDTNMVADKIFFNPFLFKTFTENPFKLKERTYPIDFGYKMLEVYNLTIDFGEDYSIEEKPNDIIVRLPNKKGDFLCSISQTDNKLKLTSKSSINSSVLNPDYYKFLKAFVNKIIDTQTKSVVVLKKK
jgi:hypothetical protein